jgi:hypothetical protein
MERGRRAHARFLRLIPCVSAELANGGRLLVSELRVFGACSERQGEPGTMALRRR